MDHFDHELQNASPDFAQGWRDGCESGMKGGQNSFYQMFNRNNSIDGYKMSYSPDYSKAWGNAWWYCYRAEWTDQRSKVWSSTFAGHM